MKAMFGDQVKKEIVHVLDRLSDSSLIELLDFLKQLEEKQFINRENLSKILSEDEELLKRLAQ